MSQESIPLPILHVTSNFSMGIDLIHIAGVGEREGRKMACRSKTGMSLGTIFIHRFNLSHTATGKAMEEDTDWGNILPGVCHYCARKNAGYRQMTVRVLFIKKVRHLAFLKISQIIHKMVLNQY